MSQSSKIGKVFGSLKLQQDLKVKIGSTSSVSTTLFPTTPTALADAAAVLTVAQLQAGILTITPTAARNLTLPSATLLAASYKVVGDSFTFTVINLQGTTYVPTVVADASGALVGNGNVAISSSGTFRLIMTSSSAYVVYRI